MKYRSVWDEYENTIEGTKKKHINKWIPTRYIIGEKHHDMCNVRALIAGSKNQLLFIIYPPHLIEVLDMKSFKSIAKDFLPITGIYGGSCFVKLPNFNHMIMFSRGDGLSIKYNEKKQKFEYEKLPGCHEFEEVYSYSYICIKDFVVLFGGYGNGTLSDNIYTYSIKKKEWSKCIHKLPIPISGSFAVLNDNCTQVHIIGGYDRKQDSKQHLLITLRELVGWTSEDIRIIVENWIRNNKLKIGWIIEFSIIIANYII